jgi:large subunit ribosomal protein L24
VGIAVQNTLLTIAVVVILALVGALVAPFVVDWNDFRPLVEREASRLTGVPVRVSGDIDVRLLPAPKARLAGVTVGGVPAKLLDVELSLGSLMRGEWRATEAHLVGPQLDLTFDDKGRLQLPALPGGFDPAAVSIERLHVEDGRIVVADAASGSRFTFDKIWFSGDARSLAGPLRGEGSAMFDGAMYPYRLNVGRLTDEGRQRVRLNLDPVDRPLSIEVDGDVALAQGVPHFDGSASISRSVQPAANQVTKAAGKPAAKQTDKPGATEPQPWRAGAKLKATPASVLVEEIEFHYGPDDQGVKLAGTADMKFGPQPRIEGVLSARQLDLDRTLSLDGDKVPAAAALRMLAEAAGGALPLPMQLGIGIDSVTLSGGTVLDVRGDLATSKDGWSLSGFEFRAPGSSRVRLAGRLTAGPAADAAAAGATFKGAVDVESANLRALVGWLEGRADIAAGPVRALKARGDVTFGSGTLAVERLKASVGRETVEGRLSYLFAAAARPARLEADLRASKLDVDGLQNFLDAALAGSALERPQEIALTAHLDSATVAGIAVRDLTARLRSDASGFDIERLSVGDLGGAAVSVGGKLNLSPPRGDLTVDIDARDLAGAAALLGHYVPTTAPLLARFAGSAKLRGVLAVEATAVDKGVGKLTLDGTVGAVRLAVNGDLHGDFTGLDPASLNKTTLRLDGTLASDNGAALVRLLALDRIAAVDDGRGQLTVSLEGPVGGDLQVKGQLAAPGLDAAASGTAALKDDTVSAKLRMMVRRAELRPLSPRGHSLPVSFGGWLAIDKDQIALTDADGTIAGANLRGRVVLGRSPDEKPWNIDGSVDADALDVPAVLAAVAGMPAGAGRAANPTPAATAPAAWAWPVEPFARGVTAGYRGRIVFRSQRAMLTPALMLRNLRGTLALDGDDTVFDGVAGDLGGGRFTGRLSLRRGSEGLRAKTRISLKGVDATILQPAATRPPVTGRLDLDAEVEGAGLSPSALIGSLDGSGTLSLNGAQFASLDPRAFEAVIRAADQGLPVDGIRIKDFMSKALDRGSLPVRHAKAGLRMIGGQIRLQDVAVEATGASLSLSGNLDLTQGALEARLVLSGAEAGTGGKPDVFVSLRGPLAAPGRNIDVSALTGWLTLRAVDQQAKKLEAAEQERARERERVRALQPPPPPAQQRPRSAAEPIVPPVPVAPGTIPALASPGATPSDLAPATLAPATLAPPLPTPQTIAPAPQPGSQMTTQSTPPALHARPQSARPMPAAPLQIVPQD